MDSWLWGPSQEKEFVNITIYAVSATLVKGFIEKIVKPNYPGGISPAIVDLMRKAVHQSHSQEENDSLQRSSAEK